MLGLGNSITSGVTLDAFTWLPTDVNGLVVWHKNGTGVDAAQWDDSSGNNNHAAQSTSGNQASEEKGGLHFDGSDDFYEYSTQLNIGASEGYTLAMVYHLDDTDVKNTVFSKDANSTFVEFFDEDTVRINYAGSVVNLNGGTHEAGTDHILVITRAATTGAHRTFENGSDTIVATGTQTGIGLWENLGIRNDNDRAFNGKIYEIMVWDNVVLAGDDLTNLNTYLTNVRSSL
tara:strand:- start:617 stop:1309 length:693 start_codon:yes stop_codon:yes gene_type:complete